MTNKLVLRHLKQSKEGLEALLPVENLSYCKFSKHKEHSTLHFQLKVDINLKIQSIGIIEVAPFQEFPKKDTVDALQGTIYDG